MKLVAALILMLIGIAWVACAVLAFQFWKWDGFGCVLCSLPGVAIAMAGAVKLEQVD